MREIWQMQDESRVVNTTFCADCPRVAPYCPIRLFKKNIEGLPGNSDMRSIATQSGVEVEGVFYEDGTNRQALMIRCGNDAHPVLNVRGTADVTLETS